MRNTHDKTARLTGPHVTLTMINIVLVDDQAIVREGLHLLLQSQPDMQVVGTAKDEAEALAFCRQVAPDVVIMGLDEGDLEATRAIKQQHHSVIIVALVTNENRQHLIQLTEAGTSAFLPKRAALTELVNAIRAASTGEIVLHPSVASTVMEGNLQRMRASHTDLTSHERQVIEMIAEGMPNKEIARRLDVSVRTIARYQASILRKLNLRNRTELVRYATANGPRHV